MSRLSRKNRTNQELGVYQAGGLMNMFDDAIKLAFRINDEEYDRIAEAMTDEEMDLFVGDNDSFSQRRKLIELLNKYIK